MHIEPGFVQPAKILLANAGALTVAAWAAKEHLIADLAAAPWKLAKTAVAAVAFSVFMESFAMPVGPSELHFVGAMAMYLTLGFVPTLLGFGIGLAFQGLLFSPWDLAHLGVNSLSLMLPLIALHYTIGRKYFDENLKQRLSWAKIVKMDAVYYSGVTGMVGFWLWFGGSQTAFADWAAFASTYLAVVALEPVLTWGVISGLKKVQDKALVKNLFEVHKLTTA